MARGINELTAIGQYNGVFPRIATRSIWTLDIVATSVVTINAIEYKITDTSNQVWRLINTTQLAVGNNSLNFEAVEYGNVVGVAGDLLTPVTPFSQIITVTAATNSSVGIKGETNAEFRARLAAVSYTESQGFLFSLANALIKIPDLNDVFIKDNPSEYPDANGVPAHGLWVIIEGSSTEDFKQEIGTVFLQEKVPGLPMKGAIEIRIIEDIPNTGGVTTEQPRVFFMTRRSFLCCILKLMQEG